MENRLERVVHARFEYRRLQTKIEELTSLAEKMTSTISAMPKGQGGDRELIWARLIDYKALLQKQLEEYIADCMALEEELKELSRPEICTVMKYYYIDGKTISEIAEATSYATRTVDRFLSQGRLEYSVRFGDE